MREKVRVMVYQPAAVLKDVFLQGGPKANTGKCRHLKTADMASSLRLVRLLERDVAARACRSVKIESKTPIARPLAHASAPIPHAANTGECGVDSGGVQCGPTRTAPHLERRRTTMDPLLQIEDRRVAERFQGGNKRYGLFQDLISILLGKVYLSN